jgi:hypothetical protein
MEDSNANQATSPSPITNRQSPTARRSGGPRTAEGQRRSCQNARKHGLYTDERFLEGAALELGDDPRQFQRLLKSLVEARQPVGALEMALVEGIALLLCKQARLDRSELAVQVSNLHHHDLERRKLFIKVGHDNSDAVECGSADPRFWGPRFFRGATDKPRTPAPGSALPSSARCQSGRLRSSPPSKTLKIVGTNSKIYCKDRG